MSTLVSTWPVGLAQQKWNYTEQLDILFFGRQAFWSLTLRGGNITAPAVTDTLANAEFTVSAVRLTNWKPEYEVLTDLGVGLIPRERLIREGIFLQLPAENPKVVDQINDALKTAFGSVSSADEGRLYLSSIDYENFVRSYFWSRVRPQWLAGIQGLVDQTKFLSSPVSVASFGRSRNGEVWVSYSGLQAEGIGESGAKLSDIFGGMSSVTSAPLSNSTTITVRRISGLISGAPQGRLLNFANNTARFSYDLRAGEKIPDLNFTFAVSPPQVTFTRRIDAGALSRGEVAEVTLTVNNSAPSGGLDALKIDFTDSWWEGDFELVKGSNKIHIDRLPPGQSRSQAYQIRLVTDASKSVSQTKAQSLLSYTYTIGGQEYTGLAMANSAPIVLNHPGPALRGILTGSVERLERKEVPLTLTITNYGSRAAFDVIVMKDGVKVASIGSITAGGSTKVPVDVTLGTLIDGRALESVSLVWTAVGNETAHSNSIPVIPQISSANYPSLVTTQTVRYDYKGEDPRSEVEVAVKNSGFLLAPNVTVSIPSQPSVKITVNHPNTVMLDDGSIKIISNRIPAGENFTFTYLIESKTGPESIVLPPVSAVIPFGKSQLVFRSNPAPVPLGLRLQKEFDPPSGFVSANITVTLRLRNLGGLKMYDVLINDPPSDSLGLKSGDRSRSINKLEAGDELDASYVATMRRPKQGPESPIVANFTLAGRQFHVTGQPPQISIYPPPVVSIQVRPVTLAEGEPFDLVATISNNSPKNITDVRVLFQLPGRLILVSGNLENLLPSLPASSNQSIILSARSVEALSVLLPPVTVQFSSEGIAYTTTIAGIPIRVADNVMMRYVYPLSGAFVAAMVTVGLTRALLRRGSEELRQD